MLCYGLYLAKLLDIIGKIYDIFVKNDGIYLEKIWDILWYILVKNCWIYLSKLWDILVHWIY